VTTYQLYIDDSGTRNPDHSSTKRKDGMDHFALGGILMDVTHKAAVRDKYDEFIKRWEIATPLHSTKIRGKRKEFRWLGKDDQRALLFYAELEQLLLSIDVLGIACVIDRPGYNNRYRDKYGPARWLMCKTAYCILVERAAKFAKKSGSLLEVFFEETGKAEDRAISDYARSLKGTTSSSYEALSAADFKKIILGDPQRQTKKSPMIQIADLYLYAIAKSGYDRNYDPFRKLLENGRIIDAHLERTELGTLGVKYSCFEVSAEKN
jgi:hypothetical protein